MNTCLLLSPELLVTLAFFLVLAIDLLIRDSHRNIQGTAVLGLFSAFIATVLLEVSPATQQLQLHQYVGSVLVVDNLALYFKSLILFLAFMACLLSYKAFEEEGSNAGEFYSLILVATLGELVAVSSHELLTFFIAFELLSIPLYMLAGFRRYDSLSAEAGVKYFLTGALSSAIMLFGMSWIYGSVGTTEFSEMAQRLGQLQGVPQAMIIGLVMVLIGLAFKVSAAPFHNWSPDVYSGSPTVVVAYLSTAPKSAMIGFMLRLFWGHLNISSPSFNYTADWVLLFAILSIMSMFIGNLCALPQLDVKRLLAYSGIAQIGYLGLGLAACSKRYGSGDGVLGIEATIFYVTVYALSNFLAWACVYLVCRTSPDCQLERFSGLSKRSPLLAFGLLLSLMSLAGVPPLSGFVGKFMLFRAVYQANMPFLVVFAIINSVISLYYYFKVLKVAYFSEVTGEPIALTASHTAIVGMCLATIVFFGLWPGLLDQCFAVATTVIH